MSKKIVVVERTVTKEWTTPKLKVAWNSGTRGFILNSMGTDHFPVERAIQIGFKVKWLPDYCSSELAEHAFTLLRGIVLKTQYDRPVHKSTCLVIGSEGNVGKKVCELAEERGMKVLKHDLVLKFTKKGFLKKLGRSKVVFLCIPLTKESIRFYNEEKIRVSRKVCPFVINVSGRNKLVGSVSLLTGLNAGAVCGYGVDDQPSDRRLRNHDRVFWTPHVGWKSQESSGKRKKLFNIQLKELEKELIEK